jgi:hypothetical protein
MEPILLLCMSFQRPHCLCTDTFRHLFYCHLLYFGPIELLWTQMDGHSFGGMGFISMNLLQVDPAEFMIQDNNVQN